MSDVYKIGVQLAVTGNMADSLAALSSQLLGLNQQTESLMKKWNSFGDNAKLAIKGAGLVAVGTGVLDFFGKALSAGEELVHVQQQMVAAGTSQANIATATAEAYKNASTYGMKVADVLADIKESTLIFGSTDAAIRHLGDLEKLRTISEGVQSGSGASNVGAVFAASKAGELKGLTGENLAHLFDGMTKAIEASGGKVTANDFMQATKYGKLASVGWDEQFYTHVLPAIIQETGASTAGTSLMSLYGTFMQGKVTQRALGEISNLGLIGDPSKIIYDKQGNPKGFNPGAVVGSDELTKNPYSWVQKYLLPAIEKKDGHPFSLTNSDDLAVLGSILGNRNAAAVAALLANHPRIDKDIGLVDQAPGLAGAQGLMDNDPGRVMARVSAAWNNLMTAFGAPAVAPFLSGLNLLAAGIQKVTAAFAAFSANNPEYAKYVAGGVGVAGAGMFAGGAGMVGLAVYRSIFGLPAAATALSASAAALTRAAAALGGEGVAGGGPGRSPTGKVSGAAIAGHALNIFGAAVDMPSDMPGIKQKWADADATDKAMRDWMRGNLPGWMLPFIGGAPESSPGQARIGMPYIEQPRSPYGSLTRDPSAHGDNLAGPPVVNVAAPNVQTQVTVKIGERELTSIISETVAKIIGSFGGFSKGAPSSIGSNMMPAVDGAQ